MNDYYSIEKIITEKPCDLEKLNQAFSECTPLSKKEMAKLAVKAMETADISVLEGYDDRKPLKEYDEEYIRKVESLPLLKVLQILLDNGLDPNYRLINYHDGREDVYLLREAQYWFHPYISATVIKLLLENGADPNLDIGDEGTAYIDLDANVAMDITLLPDVIPPEQVQCWFVMTGYGGRPEKVSPFTLRPGHCFEELKEFKNYDFFIEYDQERKENMLHIINRITGEEIGIL